MNNKIFLWVGLAAVVIVITASLYLFFVPSTPTQPPDSTGVTFPIGGSGGPNTTTVTPIVLVGGETVSAKDFIHNKETTPDVENPGSYVLAGSLGYCLADGTCPSGASTEDFSVTYNKNTNFFNIVLLKEPLGSTRLSAESFLKSRLGLSNAEMCSLRYFVGTPYWINEYYDDRNLGFSFCPGSVKLPQ